jgi:hypothetical protein
VALRFVQIGDAHLGAALAGLPTAVADELREAARQALRDAFAKARELQVDLVLMPGDLFEINGVDPAAQVRFIYAQAERLEPTPVVIAPGNHDPYGPETPYAAINPPPNVVLFTAPELALVETRAGMVAGRAYVAGRRADEVDWAALAQPPAGCVLVLHASVLRAQDGRKHTETIVPVSPEALAQSGFAYSALGHYHDYREFARGPAGGPSYAAYAGCPQGLGWDEPGAKGYLIGELGDDGARLEFVTAASHVFQRKELTLPPEYAEDAPRRLETAIAALKGDLDSGDLLDLRVRGRWPELRRDELEAVAKDLAKRVWHMRAMDWGEVDFTPPLVERGKSEAVNRFLDNCDERTGEGGADGAAWELARYMGHRLLSGRALPDEVA